MSSPFVGQIQPFSFDFAPKGWAKCDGNLLAISQNNALYSVIGIIYGGDGRTTFALPDLRGRAPMQFGHGPGLSDRRIGQKSGSQEVTLTISSLPWHNHMVRASNSPGDSQQPQGALLAPDSSGEDRIFTSSPNTGLNFATLSNTGGNQPHENMAPFLVINWCISLYGVIPQSS